MKFNFFCLCFLFISNILAQTVSINDTRWKQEWSEEIKQAATLNTNLLSNTIEQKDLEILFCPNYNQLSENDKTLFWIYFFSGLAKAESSFNSNARSKAPKGGHGNYGLLQLSKRTARVLCNLNDKDILDPQKNLSCGIKLMNYQLKGAPNKNGKITKKRTLNRIFTSPIFFWGPLRQKDYRGKKILTSWMKSHIINIPNCQ